MIILDEFKQMLNIMLKPSSATSSKTNFAKSSIFYYKATAIPFVLLLAFTFFIHNQITQSIDMLFEILIWLIIPLFALFETAVFQLSGKNFFSSFKHGSINTFHSVLLSNSAIILVLWICVLYPPIAPILLGLAILWAFIILVTSLSVNQGATRTEAFIAVVVGYLLMYLIINAIAIILVGQIPPPAA